MNLYFLKQNPKLILEKGFDNGIITKEEFHTMKIYYVKPVKLYATFKVHKPHAKGSPLPMRPIVNASGFLTENIALFIKYHIKTVSIEHESYLQDTADFLGRLRI